MADNQDNVAGAQARQPRQPVEQLSFEDALAELEEIVTSLEQGRTTLQQAIDAYERGTTLRQHCERKLNEAQEVVERITRTASGEVGTAPFDVD